MECETIITIVSISWKIDFKDDKFGQFSKMILTSFASIQYNMIKKM